MGVYTYAEQTLGLNPSKETLRLKLKYENGEALSESELTRLLNSTARWETFEKHVKSGTLIDIDDYMAEDGKMSLEELFRNHVVELNNVYLTSVQGNKYRRKFDVLRISFDYNDIDNLLHNLKQDLHEVQLLQKEFDKNNDGYVVEGYYDFLEKQGDSLLIYAESKLEDLQKQLLGYYEKYVEETLMKYEKHKKLLEKNKKKLG